MFVVIAIDRLMEKKEMLLLLLLLLSLLLFLRYLGLCREASRNDASATKKFNGNIRLSIGLATYDHMVSRLYLAF